MTGTCDVAAMVLGAPARPSFRKRGEAKAEAKRAAWGRRVAARDASKRARVRRGQYEALQRVFRRAGEHGAATKERLLEFVAEHLGQNADRAERMLQLVTAEALRQVDPLTWLNKQLNEAEEKAAMTPRVDPALLAEGGAVEVPAEPAKEEAC